MSARSDLATAIETRLRALMPQKTLNALSNQDKPSAAPITESSGNETAARTTAICEDAADVILNAGGSASDLYAVSLGAKLALYNYRVELPGALSPEGTQTLKSIEDKIEAYAESRRQELATPVVYPEPDDSDEE